MNARIAAARADLHGGATINPSIRCGLMIPLLFTGCVATDFDDLGANFGPDHNYTDGGSLDGSENPLDSDGGDRSDGSSTDAGNHAGRDAGILPGRLALDPNGLLVSDGIRWIVEFTLEGREVARVAVPLDPMTGGDDPRDLIQMGDRVFVWNGTFHPVLSVFDNHSGQWNERTLQGWSTRAIRTYGGVAKVDGRVIVTDMNTAQGGEAQGIIIFDDEPEPRRVLQAQEYIDVATGLDGYVYGLRNRWGDIDIIDISRATVIESFRLEERPDWRSIAVARDGTIYLASWDGHLVQFADQRRPTGRMTFDANLMDIALRHDGTMAIGAWYGGLYITHAAQIDRPNPVHTHVERFGESAFVAFID